METLESALLPHLDAAFNLARWLTRDDSDAEDVVQEACLRATRYFAGFKGVDARSWFLAIVRNTCYTWLTRNRSPEAVTVFDEELHSTKDSSSNPEETLLRDAGRDMLRGALEDLPAEFREVVVLRELEGLSYKEIAATADLPIGTVMSRLARARERLQRALAHRMGRER